MNVALAFEVLLGDGGLGWKHARSGELILLLAGQVTTGQTITDPPSTRY